MYVLCVCVCVLCANDRHLRIKRYSVTPLSPDSGLIGWVPHCDTLHQLIKEYRYICTSLPMNQLTQPHKVHSIAWIYYLIQYHCGTKDSNESRSRSHGSFLWRLQQQGFFQLVDSHSKNWSFQICTSSYWWTRSGKSSHLSIFPRITFSLSWMTTTLNDFVCTDYVAKESQRWSMVRTSYKLHSLSCRDEVSPPLSLSLSILSLCLCLIDYLPSLCVVW